MLLGDVIVELSVLELACEGEIIALLLQHARGPQYPVREELGACPFQGYRGTFMTVGFGSNFTHRSGGTRISIVTLCLGAPVTTVAVS